MFHWFFSKNMCPEVIYINNFDKLPENCHYQVIILNFISHFCESTSFEI